MLGTSESPSVLNASPEAAVGGALAILRTGDTVRLDVAAGSLNVVRCADGGEITPAVLEVRRGGEGEERAGRLQG